MESASSLYFQMSLRSILGMVIGTYTKSIGRLPRYPEY